MKKVLTTTLLAATLVSGMACAADAAIPWADNSGGTESTHIAAMGQDLNRQHQQITKTSEGVWAANSGSISCPIIHGCTPVRRRGYIAPFAGEINPQSLAG